MYKRVTFQPTYMILCRLFVNGSHHNLFLETQRTKISKRKEIELKYIHCVEKFVDFFFLLRATRRDVRDDQID